MGKLEMVELTRRLVTSLEPTKDEEMHRAVLSFSMLRYDHLALGSGSDPLRRLWFGGLPLPLVPESYHLIELLHIDACSSCHDELFHDKETNLSFWADFIAYSCPSEISQRSLWVYCVET